MTLFGVILLIVGICAIGLLAIADPLLLSRITGEREKPVFLHRDLPSGGR
ncbi:hypothetical protein [Sphaerisporangium fuscum]|nr:hypothetical protein [Sphaerisporangium fuscum]